MVIIRISYSFNGYRVLYGISQIHLLERYIYYIYLLAQCPFCEIYWSIYRERKHFNDIISNFYRKSEFGFTSESHLFVG